MFARGLHPRLHTLDNEASTSLKDFLTAEHVEYQLVPPHIHRRNSAERAIQTFKNHFIAGLTSTDPNFPLSNWCRLATNTIFFIHVTKVPCNKRPTYAYFVCSFRPQKPEPYRTRITVSGNLIDYPGNLSMKVADMTTFKILVNSTLSTPGAKWLGLDVKNCSSTSIKSNWKSSAIIIYTTLNTKAKSMWKFAAVCTVSPRQESSPKTTYPFPWKIRLFSCSQHPWTLAPSMATDHILPHRRRFWRLIRWQRTC